MLPKTQRLNRNRVEFVFKKGKSFNTSFFTAKFFLNNTNIHRFCVVVSKKINKEATKRNRLRRQIYELLRTKQNPNTVHNRNLDCIIIAKPKSKTASFQEMKNEIAQIFQRLK